MGRQLSPRYGQVILVRDALFWQLSIDHNIDVQLVFSWAPKLAKSVRVNIGCPVVRTDGRSAVGVRSRDYQILWDGWIY